MKTGYLLELPLTLKITFSVSFSFNEFCFPSIGICKY